jgi:hypothetical protein
MATRREFLSRTVAASAAAPALTAAKPNSVPLRTHEWFGDQVEHFNFPLGWQIAVQHMKGVHAPALTKAQIREAVLNPVGTKRLQEIAAGKKTVAIAFDDLTRPTPTCLFVPYVIEELRAEGIKDENILFVTAYGCHYQMNGLEVAKKLGQETVAHHPWINHNIWENHADLGVSKAGNNLGVNVYITRPTEDYPQRPQGPRHPGLRRRPEIDPARLPSMKAIRYMHQEIKRTQRVRRDPDGTEIFYLWDNEQRQDMIEAARRAGGFQRPVRVWRPRAPAGVRGCGRRRKPTTKPPATPSITWPPNTPRKRT